MNELSIYDSMDLSVPVSTQELSIYDPNYPVALFSDSMNLTLHEADKCAQEIYRAVAKAAPSTTQLANAKKSVRYVVDMSDKTIENIESGKIKLTTNKAGETFAQIMDENGKFGKKLPIKKEDVVVGVDPVTMAMAMQMKAMQEQLEDIADQINRIDKNVKEVIKGQQNDRIGQYLSGVSLYAEARNIEDSELRKEIIAQSLKALSDSLFQIRLNMMSDIQYLANGEYKDVKGKRTQLIDERVNNINMEFMYIHQAEIMKAAIYCTEKEYSAMSAVLDEYSQFIKENIKGNAGFLAQLDVRDDGTNRGVWNSRSNLQLDTKGIRQQLSMKEKTLYLSMSEEE